MNKLIIGVSAAVAVFGTSGAIAADGKAVYAQSCAQCHAGGIAGAPKIGDKAAWSGRLGNGRDTLLAAVLKGKGAMPPKGGNASLSDADAKAAMDFILNQSK